MWNPFKTKVFEAKVYAVPAINSVWESRGDDPFARYKVTVCAAREGYVQYRFGGTYGMQTSLSLEMFHSFYSLTDQKGPQ